MACIRRWELRAPGRQAAAWSACVLLGVAFAALGATKLIFPHVPGAFVSLGMPEWVWPLVGLAEIAGALMLLWPRAVRWGAALLGCLVTTLAGIYTVAGGHRPPPLALGLLGAIAVVAYLRRPSAVSWDRFARELDRFADAEIAKQRAGVRGVG